MRLFYLLLLVLTVTGAGCFSQNMPTSDLSNTTETKITGKTWLLSFDLPDGWIMTEECTRDNERVRCGNDIASGPPLDMVPLLDTYIDPNALSISIQNTTKLPLFGGIAPADEVADYYQSDDVAVIEVTQLERDSEVPPSDALSTEDLGDGFVKVITCDLVTTPECRIYGQKDYEYYLETSSGEIYRFTVLSVGVDEQLIEAIILSASK